MQWSDVTAPASRGVLRQFAALWLVFCFLLAGWQWHTWNRTALAGALAAAGALGVVAGLLFPGSVRWLYTAMMALAFPVGWLFTRLLLAALFYGLITPLGIVFRLLGRDPLRLRLDAARSSWWEAREQPADSSSYLRMF
jgi:hypothetical protein